MPKTQFIFCAQSVRITQPRFNKVDVAGFDDSWASWFVIIANMSIQGIKYDEYSGVTF